MWITCPKNVVEFDGILLNGEESAFDLQSTSVDGSAKADWLFGHMLNLSSRVCYRQCESY